MNVHRAYLCITKINSTTLTTIRPIFWEYVYAFSWLNWWYWRSILRYRCYLSSWDNIRPWSKQTNPLAQLHRSIKFCKWYIIRKVMNKPSKWTKVYICIFNCLFFFSTTYHYQNISTYWKKIMKFVFSYLSIKIRKNAFNMLIFSEKFEETYW